MKGYLIPLFAVATLFPRLLTLPAPWQQVQLTELLFLPLLWLYRGNLLASAREFPRFTAVAVCYVAVSLLSGFAAASAGAVLEAGARGYLCLVALVTASHLRRYGSARLTRWWKWATVGAAALALLYYGLIVLGVPDPVRWVARFPDYPYLGEVYRLRATGSTYGMWVMLVLPGLLLTWEDWRRGAHWWPVAVVLLAIAPTLSKEILLVPAGLLLLSGWPAVVRTVGSLALVVLLLAGTHYLVVSPEADRHPTSYMGESTSLTIGAYRLVESVYLPIKRVAVRVGLQHPWVGVGPGQFAHHSGAATQAGELPGDFGPFDPHSTWTGAFAETGWLGLFALTALVVVLLMNRPAELTVVGVLLLLFLVASTFKDILNFRGLWVVVGWYLAGGRNGWAGDTRS